MSKECVVRSAIRDFYRLMDTCADNAQSIPAFADFLQKFIRMSSDENYLPTIEIITILKKEKPTVFTLLKNELTDHAFNAITMLEMDYELAKRHLQHLLSDHHDLNNRE